MEPVTFTPSQLEEYFRHISLEPISVPTFSALKSLITHHMAVIPFENISLHYSKNRNISLDPDHLFEKFVRRGRGGYCMEVNEVFSIVLRSLGFDVWTTGGRVSNRKNNTGSEGFGGWNHMVSIVTVDEKRYLVDVGFGGGCPVSPIPLETDVGTPGVGSQLYRLVRQPVGLNRKLKMWILQTRDSRGEGWMELYCFSDQVEFGRNDYEVMNHGTSTMVGSIFLNSIMCVKTIVDNVDGEKKAVGRLILRNNVLKRRTGDMTVLEITFRSEHKRVEVLRKYFGMTLTEEEQAAIEDSTLRILVPEHR